MLTPCPVGLPKSLKKCMREMINKMIFVDQEVIRLNTQLLNMQMMSVLTKVEKEKAGTSGRVKKNGMTLDNRRQGNEDLAAYSGAWSVWPM